MGVPDFLGIKYLNKRANLCKNNFKPATIKNDNGTVEMRKRFARRKLNQQLHQFKKMAT